MHATDRSVIVELADQRSIDAAVMLIATGVHDDLPPIDGLAERWGKSVFNCPFCDGWEHRDQPVVVIDAAPGADHLASHAPVVDATTSPSSKQTPSRRSPATEHR